jgi:polygalacturonase
VKKIQSLLLFLAFTPLMTDAVEYNILDFGAGRNKLSTVAIQKAIDTCYSRGGGTVIVPS